MGLIVPTSRGTCSTQPHDTVDIFHLIGQDRLVRVAIRCDNCGSEIRPVTRCRESADCRDHIADRPIQWVQPVRAGRTGTCGFRTEHGHDAAC